MLWEISGFTCLQDAKRQGRTRSPEEKKAAKKQDGERKIAVYALMNVAAKLPQLRSIVRDRSTDTETEEFKQMPRLKRANLNNAIMRLDAIQSIADDCLSSKSKDVEFTKESVKEIVKKLRTC